MKTSAFTLNAQLQTCAKWSKCIENALQRANPFTVNTITLDAPSSDIGFTFSANNCFVVQSIEFPVCINPSDDGWDVSAVYDVCIEIDNGSTARVTATLDDNYAGSYKRSYNVNSVNALSIELDGTASMETALTALFRHIQAGYPVPARITEKLLA